MALTDQHWNLFGYDVRTLPALWTSAWREVLWSEEAPIRQWLDEPVAVYEPWQEGQPAPQMRIVGRGGKQTKPSTVARLLPDDLVLSCWLNLPEKAEGHLLSAIALDVRARSPFPADDTVFGWRIAGREAGILRVCLCIASRSAVSAWLHRFLTPEEIAVTEVRAEVEQHYVIIEGFGEGFRNQRYTRQLKKLGLWAGLILVLSLLLIMIPAGLRAIQLNYYQNELAEAQQASRAAVEYRNNLTASNERILEANRQLASAGNPHRELVRLTALLNDEVYLNTFEHTAGRIRIDGMADNAAQLMSILSESVWYSDVKAPSAIRRDNRSGLERFVLDLTLADSGEATR